MLWQDDPDLQREIILAIPKKAFPGVNWVKDAIWKCDNQSWDDPEVREGNIENIKKKARAIAKRKGVKDARPITQSREYVSGGLGQSYATMDLMQKNVEAIRLKYWGCIEPPFSRSAEGRSEAAAWFFRQEEEDRKAHPDGLPGDGEVFVRFTAQHLRRLYDLENEVRTENSYMGENGFLRSTDKAPLNMLKALVHEAEHEDNVIIEHVNVKSLVDRLELRSFVRDDWRNYVHALPGAVLGDLLKDLRGLVAASGWWGEKAALGRVLFDLVITAKPRVSYKERWRDGVKHEEFTIKISAPATPEEVTQAYADELEYLGYNPKPITVQQSALFQLVERHPSKTWAERYKVWQGWCEKHPELKKYAHWRSLYESYENAKERAGNGWGQL